MMEEARVLDPGIVTVFDTGPGKVLVAIDATLAHGEASSEGGSAMTDANITEALDDLDTALTDLLYSEQDNAECFATAAQALKAARWFDEGIETQIDDDPYRAHDLINEAIITLEEQQESGFDEDRKAFAEYPDLTVGPMDAVTWWRLDAELGERKKRVKGKDNVFGYRRSKRIRALLGWRKLCRDCAQYPEFYMVSRANWYGAFRSDEKATGLLCLNCLEQRLGRWLADDEIGDGGDGEFDQERRIRRAQRPLFGDHQKLVAALDEAFAEDKAEVRRYLGDDPMPEPEPGETLGEAIHRCWLDDIAVARRWLPRLTPVSAGNALKMIAEGYPAQAAIFKCWREQNDQAYSTPTIGDRDT
jgi:hypothetical protein